MSSVEEQKFNFDLVFSVKKINYSFSNTSILAAMRKDTV